MVEQKRDRTRGSMNYRQPFIGDYQITQYFGEKITDPKGHTGIDYGCPSGTPVLASESGSVFFSGWKDGGYGYCVFIKHSDGNVTIYEHLLRDIEVSVGQKVSRGQMIGYSGSTGNSTGPHLHFEVRDSAGKAFDPMTILHSVDDTVSDVPPLTLEPDVHNLKEPSELGEYVEVVCTDGAKVFNQNWSIRSWGFPRGTKLHFTGKTAKRPGYPEYTYCEVYEEPKKYFVAVHNNDVQILDNAE